VILFMFRRSLITQIALLGGLGKTPVAPGTVASIVAGLPAVYLLGFASKPLAVTIVIVTFLVSWYAADGAEKMIARPDPKEIVVDELMGYLVTMLWIPVTAKSALLGLAAFRLFDIWKPWPVSVLDEKVKGGLGIMLDDAGAGVYAHALLWLALRYWP
jgi:phosphatidylglycerophosphatase A